MKMNKSKSTEYFNDANASFVCLNPHSQEIPIYIFIIMIIYIKNSIENLDILKIFCLQIIISAMHFWFRILYSKQKTKYKDRTGYRYETTDTHRCVPQHKIIFNCSKTFCIQRIIAFEKRLKQNSLNMYSSIIKFENLV